MKIVENLVTIGEITGRSLMFLMTHGVCTYSLESKVCYLKEFNRSSKSCEYEIVES